MSIAIEAVEVSKRYSLQGVSASQGTLFDAAAHWLSAPARLLRRRDAAIAPSREPEEFWALRDVSFKVEHGEAIGVIGRNGAGKSTLLKIFSRVTEPTSGHVKLNGRVASLLEVGTGFHDELSGRENIFLNGAILGMRRQEIARRLDQIIDYAGVAKFLELPIKRYSSGMKMRLAFAVGAFLESEILIVDEVLAVGDAAFQDKCLGTMREAARGGRTVLFVSHNMAAIASLTRRCVLLDGGRVVYDGNTADAVQRYGGTRDERMWRGLRAVEDIECSRRWRGEVVARMLAVGLADDQSEDIEIGAPLRFQIRLDADVPVQRIRVGYSINTKSGTCVLSGLSPLVDVPKGTSMLQLATGPLALQPGEYDLSLSLGIGDWQDQKWEMDCLIGFGHLRVVERFADGRPFGSWYSEWARGLSLGGSLHVHPCSDTSAS
ncbi:MAG TPA: ABC transporter ATP-binding protein [Solimonas sp.]